MNTSARNMSVVLLVGLCSLFRPDAYAQQDSVFLAPLDCVVYPSVVAELGSSVAGILSSIDVERSQRVEQGELLAQLESGAEQAAVALIQARVDSDLEIQFRKKGAAFSRRQLGRVSELYEKNALSREEMDTRETDANLGKIQLEQAEENRRFLRLELAQAREMLERRSIRSPFSGVVTARLKNVGEFVDGDPVVTVAKLDVLHIETLVSANYLGEIVPGMEARVRSESGHDQEYTALVDRVDSVVDVASGTFGVRLILPNPDYSIVAGLRCTVQFLERVEKDSPAAALPADRQSESYVPDQLPLPEETVAVVQTRVVDEAGTGTDAVLQAAVQSVQNAIPKSTPDKDAVSSSKLNTDCVIPAHFDNRNDAEQESKRLDDLGISVEITESHKVIEVGHFVKSPPFQNRSSAVDYVEKLKLAGISDYFLPKGDSDGELRVSLGAYRNTEGALKRLEQILTHDLLAEIVPWTQEEADFLVIPQNDQLSSAAPCS